MNNVAALGRIALTIVLLGALVFYVTPSEALGELATCEWRWVAASFGLVPLFLACRIGKWCLLERQVMAPAPLRRLVPLYLWGMAIGLVTPGRVGELARVRAPTLSARGAGLFALEKLIEVGCLLTLCVVALPFVGVVSGSAGLLAGGVVVVVVLFWRTLLIAGLRVLARVRGTAGESLEQQVEAARRLRLRGAALLSLACFAIYVVQVQLVLWALGVAPRPAVLMSLPIVLLANLVPITVGGYGLRETLAIAVLHAQQVSAAAAAASFAIVTFGDLVIPGIIGALLRAGGFVSRGAEESKAGASVEAQEWDTFWEARRQRPIGRLLGWGRRRFVTRAIAKYIERNTERGTLVEAGCGSGEITLQVAASRGDDVVLVDYSPEALRLADRTAAAYGIEAALVECDIAELSAHVERKADSTVFNVGVVEHFENPGAILDEMLRASGRSAIAIIPERSAFWLTYFQLARLLGLVPADFFVQFFSRAQFAEIVERAGLRLIWARRVRVLGVIPYLGVCFAPAAAGVAMPEEKTVAACS